MPRPSATRDGSPVDFVDQSHVRRRRDSDDSHRLVHRFVQDVTCTADRLLRREGRFHLLGRNRGTARQLERFIEARPQLRAQIEATLLGSTCPMRRRGGGTGAMSAEKLTEHFARLSIDVMREKPSRIGIGSAIGCYVLWALVPPLALGHRLKQRQHSYDNAQDMYKLNRMIHCTPLQKWDIMQYMKSRGMAATPASEKPEGEPRWSRRAFDALVRVGRVVGDVVQIPLLPLELLVVAPMRKAYELWRMHHTVEKQTAPTPYEMRVSKAATTPWHPSNLWGMFANHWLSNRTLLGALDAYAGHVSSTTRGGSRERERRLSACAAAHRAARSIADSCALRPRDMRQRLQREKVVHIAHVFGLAHVTASTIRREDDGSYSVTLFNCGGGSGLRRPDWHAYWGTSSDCYTFRIKKGREEALVNDLMRWNPMKLLSWFWWLGGGVIDNRSDRPTGVSWKTKALIPYYIWRNVEPDPIRVTMTPAQYKGNCHIHNPLWSVLAEMPRDMIEDFLGYLATYQRKTSPTNDDFVLGVAELQGKTFGDFMRAGAVPRDSRKADETEATA